MIFSEVAGHKELKESLKKMVQGGKMPHALLFSEQSGCGALPLVLALTQYLFCKTRRALASGDDTWVVKGLFGDEPESLPTDDACQVCSSCIKIRNLAHPDFHFLFPINTTQLVDKGKKAPMDMYYEIFRKIVEENPYFSEQDLYREMGLENKMGLIGVNEASWLIDKLNFTAYEGGSKVVLILYPERMNLEAANKLLKSIEEPTEDTFFFLITNDPEKIIKTIRSRCRLIEVPPIEKEDLREAIEKKYKMSSDEALKWAVCAQGSFGRAMEMIDESQQEKEDFEDFISLFRLVDERDLTGLLALGQEIAKRGKEEQKLFCRNALKSLRTMFMLKMGQENISYASPNHIEQMRTLSERLKEDFFQKGYDIFNNSIECIERNVNAKFIFCDLCNALYINII